MCQCSLDWSTLLTQIQFPVVQLEAAAVAGPPAIWQRAHCDFWLCASCWQTGCEGKLDYLLSFHEILVTRRSHKPSCEFTEIMCHCTRLSRFRLWSHSCLRRGLRHLTCNYCWWCDLWHLGAKNFIVFLVLPIRSFSTYFQDVRRYSEVATYILLIYFYLLYWENLYLNTWNVFFPFFIITLEQWDWSYFNMERSIVIETITINLSINKSVSNYKDKKCFSHQVNE